MWCHCRLDLGMLWSGGIGGTPGQWKTWILFSAPLRHAPLLFLRIPSDTLTNWAVTCGRQSRGSIGVVGRHGDAYHSSWMIGGCPRWFPRRIFGSQALCGFKEACDCWSIVMQPTCNCEVNGLDTHLLNMTVNGKRAPITEFERWSPQFLLNEAVRASVMLLQLIQA